VGRRGGGRRRGDLGPRAPARDDVGLGGQLGVRRNHGPAGDLEVGRELLARGQDAAGAQTARADGVAEQRCELTLERLRCRAIQRKQQLGCLSGPLSRNEIGPYQETIRT
jgi:hypothetical protein